MHAADIGLLLSLISHEVRGPLGVMRGYMRLLDQHETDLSESQRLAVAAALRASDRATEILNHVSHLARLWRGDVALSLAQTALAPLLRTAVDNVVLPSAPAVTVEIGETPAVTTMADADLLAAAITGLVAAVVRAQAADTRVFLLGREETRDGERGVALTITAMAAISADHHDRPLDLTRGGLGLELPIAAFVIDAHRGQVAERRDQHRFVGVVVWLPVV